MYNLLKELFPINRSITGDGVRKSLKIIKKIIDLNFVEIKSGTKCYDWEVPLEWNINDAYILDPKGKKIIDFKKNNLHVVSYSEPINRLISLKELKKNLHTLPKIPTAIPYLTSYYHKNWGFCISYNQFKKLREGKYKVVIKSNFKKGSLTLADSVLKGKVKKEIIISSYICHPSMANDSLSGVVVAVYLYKYLKSLKSRYYTYRFIFAPETIGVISYLKKNEKKIKQNVLCGFVLTCLGDKAAFNYKKTKQNNHEIDKIVKYTFDRNNKKITYHDFWPSGSDERQYSSPSFNIPVGSLIRSVYGKFSQYHTSKDNLSFINKKKLEESLDIYKNIFNIIDSNHTYVRTNGHCEPMLSKYNLYDTIGGNKIQNKDTMLYLWILNLSDGNHTLLDIANKSNYTYNKILQCTKILINKNLITRAKLKYLT